MDKPLHCRAVRGEVLGPRSRRHAEKSGEAAPPGPPRRAPSPSTCAWSRTSRATGTRPTRSAICYVRAGQADKAVAQYAPHRRSPHAARGSIPRPPRSTRRSSRSRPTTSGRSCNLGRDLGEAGAAGRREGLPHRRGGAPAGARRPRGADEIVVRLGSLDPADIDARLAARTRPGGVRRRERRRDAVPRDPRRPAREGPRARGDRRRCARPCGSIPTIARAARSSRGPRWRRATSTARAAISIARRPARIRRC